MCLPVAPYCFAVLKEWEYAGLKCAVTQAQEFGHLCGYVRVPPGHPLYGMQFEDLGNFPCAVHRGVNFSELEDCDHEDGKGRWFGFDFGHTICDLLYDPEAPIPWLDELPELGKKLMLDLEYSWFPGLRRHYWRQPEAEVQVRMLAAQLAALV